MKKIALLLVLLATMSISISAQHLDMTGGKEFSLFSSYAKTAHGVSLKIPAGFKVLEYETDSLWLPVTNCWLDSGQGITPFFRHSLVGADGKCMMFYPALDGCDMVAKDGRGENDVYNDIAAAVNTATGAKLVVDDKTKPLLRQMAMELSPATAKRLFRADRMFVASLPMAKPYRDTFTRCVGVYLYKSGFMPLYFKILLTDAAKADVEKYISALSASVAYGTAAPAKSYKQQAAEWDNYVKQVKMLETTANSNSFTF